MAYKKGGFEAALFVACFTLPSGSSVALARHRPEVMFPAGRKVPVDAPYNSADAGAPVVPHPPALNQTPLLEMFELLPAAV